jgi:hypothetical protein
MWASEREIGVGDARVRAHGVVRTVAGCLLVAASAPVFLLVVPAFKGLGVVAVGLAAFAVLAAGITLAGRWLGVFQRRRAGSVEQPGCLPLLVTLLALLSAAVILYYVAAYCAGAYLGGWDV